jgi:hypothetical protein
MRRFAASPHHSTLFPLTTRLGISRTAQKDSRDITTTANIVRPPSATPTSEQAHELSRPSHSDHVSTTTQEDHQGDGKITERAGAWYLGGAT